MNPSWYAISTPAKSQDGKNSSSVEVSIYDEIGGFGVLAKDFVSELKQHKGKHIDLRINSVGGSVIEGDAIFNALKRHKGGLTVHIDGLAASMASVIAMAGDTIRMADNAMMMIHNPWSMTAGDADSFRKEADTLDKIKMAMVRTYSRRTGLSRDEVSEMMDEEKWMDAQEALNCGFIDEINEEPMKAAASISMDEARARFDKLKNSMSRKTKSIKAEDSAPEVVAPEAEPVVEPAPEAPAVDNSAEVNMTAELQAKVDALQADLDAKAAEAVQAADDSLKALEAAQAEIARLSSELAHKDEELAALRSEQKSAGEQAAAIVAAIGIAPSAPKTEDEPAATAAQLWAKMDGAESVDFFRKNKAAILKTFYS